MPTPSMVSACASLFRVSLYILTNAPKGVGGEVYTIHDVNSWTLMLTPSLTSLSSDMPANSVCNV